MTRRVWDAATGRELSVLSGHTGGINTASFSPDGKQVLTAGTEAPRACGTRPPAGN